MLKERLLRSHPTKNCYILVGNTYFKDNVREDFEVSPLKFDDLDLQEKAEYDYLGDVNSSGGLAPSVETTIVRRLDKTKGSIYETVAIIKDLRMQDVGGMVRDFDI